jgi:hypothetical protein
MNGPVHFAPSPYAPLAMSFFGIALGYLIMGGTKFFGYPAESRATARALGIWALYGPGIVQSVSAVILLCDFGAYRVQHAAQFIAGWWVHAARVDLALDCVAPHAGRAENHALVQRRAVDFGAHVMQMHFLGDLVCGQRCDPVALEFRIRVRSAREAETHDAARFVFIPRDARCRIHRAKVLRYALGPRSDVDRLSHTPNLTKAVGAGS